MSTRTARSTQKFSTPATSQHDDRRRRPRVGGEAAGYLLCDSENNSSVEPWEVRVQDVSRLGVGFVSSDALEPGALCRIRIGYGPMRLARRMRVKRCDPIGPNTYRIGAEFA